MRPLTNHTPKPLLQVAGKPLIEYHLEKLAAANIRCVVINVAHLGEQIMKALGDGSRFGVEIEYSDEGEPLETGGAINRALPLLGNAPFLLLNGDVWSDVDYRQIVARPLGEDQLGRLLLVPNPLHKTSGDYRLHDGLISPCDTTANDNDYTFSGISLLDPRLISEYPQARENFPLKEAFDFAVDQQRLSGDLWRGQWWDVGTPERLSELDRLLRG